MPPSLSSNRYLKRLYNEYNRKYFGGRLPETAIVQWKGRRAMQEGKFTLWGSADWVDTGEETVPVIELNRIMKVNGWQSVMKQVLLHEMVHLSAGRRVNHGPKFDAEMIRIARPPHNAFHGLW